MTTRSGGRKTALTLLVSLVVVGLAGCGFVGPMGAEGRGDIIADMDASAPTTSTVTLRDPVEDSFTVDVPEGWDSVAYSSGSFNVHRNVVSSVSPDGKTVMFVGDPKIPFYWHPAGITDIFRQTVDAFDFYEIEQFQPSEVYVPAYVTRKFGELPEFEIASVEPAPELVAKIEQGITPGSGFSATAAEVRFTYVASGSPIAAVVVGWALDGGSLWTTDVFGLATDRNPDDYRPMLDAMVASVTTAPEWTARSQANHEQSMAQIQAFGEEMTRQHNPNMAWIQQSAAASSHECKLFGRKVTRAC